MINTTLDNADELFEGKPYFKEGKAISEHLVCCICSEVFTEPYRLGCGHAFCKGCLERWLKTNKTCPVDRKPFKESGCHRDILVANIIGDFITACPWRLFGCTYINKYYITKDHKDNCTHNPNKLNKVMQVQALKIYNERESSPMFLSPVVSKKKRGVLDKLVDNPLDSSTLSEDNALPELETLPLSMRMYINGDDISKQYICNMLSNGSVSDVPDKKSGGSGNTDLKTSKPTVTKKKLRAAAKSKKVAIMAPKRKKGGKKAIISESFENQDDLFESNRYFKDPKIICEHLICSICADVFDEPFRLTCGHSFCKHCLNTWTKTNKTCPIDRIPIKENDCHKDILVANIIGDYMMACPWRLFGCALISKYYIIKDHKDKCPHNPNKMDKVMQDQALKMFNERANSPILMSPVAPKRKHSALDELMDQLGENPLDSSTLSEDNVLPEIETLPLSMRMYINGDDLSKQYVCSMLTKESQSSLAKNNLDQYKKK